jgi:hypothetical protein
MLEVARSRARFRWSPGWVNLSSTEKLPLHKRDSSISSDDLNNDFILFVVEVWES